MSLSGSTQATFPLVGLSVGTSITDVLAWSGSAWVSTHLESVTVGPLLLLSGSAAAPAYSFSGDTNTGLYRLGADDIGMAIAGALSTEWNTSGFKPCSGLQWIESNGLKATAADGSGYFFNFYNSFSVRLLYVDAVGFLNCVNGVVSNSLTAFAGQNLTIKSNGTSILFNIGVTQYLSITAALATFAAAVTVGTVLTTGDGAVGAPAHSFASEAGTGLYRIGAGDIGLAILGVKRFELTAALATFVNAVTVGTVLTVGDGAVGAPSLAFASDTTTGFYRIGASRIGLALGGVLYCDFATTGIDIKNIKIGNVAQLGVGVAPGSMSSVASIDLVGTKSYGIYKHDTVTVNSANYIFGFADVSTYSPAVTLSGMFSFYSACFFTFNSPITCTKCAGMLVSPQLSSMNGIITEMYGYYFDGGSLTGGIVTTYYGGYFAAPAAGTTRYALWAADFTCNSIIFNANGTAGAPSYSFTSDTTTGLYRIGASSIGVSLGGTLRFAFATTGVDLQNLVLSNASQIVSGNASPTNNSVGIEINSTTRALLLPRMTTAQKNALTAVNGMQIYDSDFAMVCGYNAGRWDFGMQTFTTGGFIIGDGVTNFTGASMLYKYSIVGHICYVSAIISWTGRVDAASGNLSIILPVTTAAGSTFNLGTASGITSVGPPTIAAVVGTATVIAYHFVTGGAAGPVQCSECASNGGIYFTGWYFV